jgi:hypothetical protein
MSPASTGSVAYRTFDDWHSEIEGFAMRCERLDGPVDELRAAFAAGQSGMRLTDAEREALKHFAAIDGPQYLPQTTSAAATIRGLLDRMK